MTDRPTFTAGEAAKATGVSRRTVGRMLADGRLSGTRDDAGVWTITVPQLLDAGLHLHAPTEPEPEPTGGTEADRLARLEAENAELRRRAEIAEALATERADNLADLRQALDLATRALPAPDVSPGPPVVAPAPVPVVRKWWQRRGR